MKPQIVKSANVNGVLCVLKKTNNPVSVEAGREFFLVVGGNVHYPQKGEVSDEESARKWANFKLRRLGLLV